MLRPPPRTQTVSSICATARVSAVTRGIVAIGVIESATGS